MVPLFQYPLMAGSLCLGYGSDTLWMKLLKRGLYGVLNGISSAFTNIITASFNDKKAWFIAIFQIVLVLAAVVVFGVWNPFYSARIEETVIGFFIFFLPVMSSKEAK